MASRLPTYKKAVRKKAARPGGGYNVRVSDPEVTALIVRRMMGEPLKSLAEAASVSMDTLRQWMQGETRGNCLLEAERQYREFIAQGP